MSQENNSLVSLVSESSKLEMLLIESGGEITPEIEQALAVNAEEISNKVDSYSAVLERFKVLEGYYKERADQYSSIAKQCKNVQDRLKDNLKFVMDQLGTNEISGHEMRFVKSATSGLINIIDEELIPIEYKKEVITTEIDKKRLKEDASKGFVPGTEFVPGFSLRSYPNTKQITSKASKK